MFSSLKATLTSHLRHLPSNWPACSYLLYLLDKLNPLNLLLITLNVICLYKAVRAYQRRRIEESLLFPPAYLRFLRSLDVNNPDANANAGNPNLPANTGLATSLLGLSLGMGMGPARHYTASRTAQCNCASHIHGDSHGRTQCHAQAAATAAAAAGGTLPSPSAAGRRDGRQHGAKRRARREREEVCERKRDKKREKVRHRPWVIQKMRWCEAEGWLDRMAAAREWGRVRREGSGE